METPLFGNVADDLCDFKSDSFTLSDDALDRASTDDVTQGRLGTLSERLTKVSDAKSGTVGVRDLVINHGVNIDVYIVACDDGLPANGTDLYFDVHGPQRLRADVHLYETRIHGLVKLAEARDQTDGALLDVAEGVSAWATRDSTDESNHRTKTLEEGAVCAMCHLSGAQILCV